jgi:hypothetical protein
MQHCLCISIFLSHPVVYYQALHNHDVSSSSPPHSFYSTSLPHTKVIFSFAGHASSLAGGSAWSSAPPQLSVSTLSAAGDGHQEKYGDRCQRFVVIGRLADRASVQKAVDDCLLSDAEMGLGVRAWRALEMPFEDLDI